MGRFLTSHDVVAQFGEDELRKIAGDGNFNLPEGSQIDHGAIDAEIGYADELIGGYVLGRHGWLFEAQVDDVPDLLKGLGGDIVRYRLRDKFAGQGQISETVEKRYRDAISRLKEIQAGALDLVRNDVDGPAAELPATRTESARITGPAPRASSLLEGY